jgi:hypothetical protein
MARITKFEITLATTLLLGGCAAAPASKPSEVKSPTSLNRDAYECEQKAAFAGVGSRAEAFNNCMQARGHTLNK